MNTNHDFRTCHAVKAFGSSRTLWDTPLFESQSFVAVPSVGALVEGWFLVVPRTRVLSFAEIPNSQISELQEFLQEIASVVESAYGPVSLFEHGPSMRGSTIGCGVDYAHLHLVPVSCDLISGARQISPNIKWTEVNGFEGIRRYAGSHNGYWFVQQPFGSGPCQVGVYTSGDGVSQLFRRVIANHLGQSLQYDWKNESGQSLVAATVNRLRDIAALA
jgi:ATP adenylyltransferase